jgi:GT2 family glycosyltransferase
MSNIKIGIVIATFQRPDGRTPDYLNRALYYIHNQTYRNYQVYVIGDSYTNDTELRKVVSQYPNMICYNLKQSVERERYGYGDERLWNAGGVTAANIGIDYALRDGIEYICHLGHDDWWEIDHLEKINSAIEQKGPLFICTLSTYGGSRIFPTISVTNTIIPFLPIPAGLIASTTCIKYSDTRLRVRDCYYEEKRLFPADADLWVRMAEEIKSQNKGSYIVTSVTCHHDEEGYILRLRKTK